MYSLETCVLHQAGWPTVVLSQWSQLWWAQAAAIVYRELPQSTTGRQGMYRGSLRLQASSVQYKMLCTST